MYILILHIVLFLGGPEQAFPVNYYHSEALCEQEKLRIWNDMDSTYPEAEHILYRFTCTKTRDIQAQPKKRGI